MMSDIAIRVENLGKLYRLGERQRYYSLRDSLARLATAPSRALRQMVTREPRAPRATNTLWALQDISFEVQHAETIGIIGRNGAGKSTLLKVLSRITEPTTGQAEIHGRVGSLLEVGTGFHPELTGRENVFLNGAILGMSRSEITRKFDEIVAFAEVEQFLDTSVKHYSSGMYMRLAFAVAAHMDPEILVVDEVLAVGDAQFQKKCLGKMGEVARAGRTVLFVSHNMGVISSLCNRVLRLEQGRIAGDGAPTQEVSAYLKQMAEISKTPLEARTDREGTGEARITYIRFLDETGHPVDQAIGGQPLGIEIGYRSRSPGVVPVLALSCFAVVGVKVFHIDNKAGGVTLPPLQTTGYYRCQLHKLPLAPGRYLVNVSIQVHGWFADHVQSAAMIDVIAGDYYGSGLTPDACGGLVFLQHEWQPRGDMTSP
ncbi:MAG: ABC transporter ATP-binding protein [Verrucomicrobiia bacterium]|jgi:lipopolysaccharide transport system ATP-binding protein